MRVVVMYKLRPHSPILKVLFHACLVVFLPYRTERLHFHHPFVTEINLAVLIGTYFIITNEAVN